MARAPRSTPWQPPQIQFRPSYPLDRWLEEYGFRWHVHQNEAAKRLCALAAAQLGLELHDDLARLAEATAPLLRGRLDFVTACASVYSALDGADQARQDMGQQPLVGEERTAFVRRLVDEAVRSKAGQSQKREESKPEKRRKKGP
jgi:hypothetical protein